MRVTLGFLIVFRVDCKKLAIAKAIEVLALAYFNKGDIMSKEKMTHADFIKHCVNAGIHIEKITRNYVYIDKGIPVTKSSIQLPNNSSLPMCFGSSIGKLQSTVEIFNWVEDGASLLEHVKDGKKITCIKIIRGNTGCGLKEAKEIYEENEIEWRALANGTKTD